jgi:hypothetical protein
MWTDDKHNPKAIIFSFEYGGWGSYVLHAEYRALCVRSTEYGQK